MSRCCGRASWVLAGGKAKGVVRSLVCAPCNFVQWLKVLTDAFGLRFLLALFAIQHLVKGFAAGGGRSGLVFQGLKVRRPVVSWPSDAH